MSTTAFLIYASFVAGAACAVAFSWVVSKITFRPKK